MKKRKCMIVSLCVAMLVCLLSILFTFKTICVKTISENYMNITITNQIIDFVIDNYTDMNNEQLRSLQDDLMESQELYRFNEQIFDQAVFNIENQNKLNIDDQTIDYFSSTCIQLIEENLDRKLDSDESQKVKDMLKNDALYSRFLQSFEAKINKQSGFIRLYTLSHMWILKVVFILIILFGMMYIYVNSKDFYVVYFLIITLLSSLLDYFLLLAVKLLTPLFSHFFSSESLVIPTNSILYIAMSLLILSFVLFMFGIVKRGYHE